MTNQTIDYPKLVEHALRHVVHDTLTLVAEHGLPGRHNIYITFRTDHPGVNIGDELTERYPQEMTIVLQHEFWGLEVSDDRFCVTLSFNNVSQCLEIPFQAITVFADPSVEFGLQFNLTDRATDDETDADPLPDEPGEVMEMPVAEAEEPTADEPKAPVREGDGAEVVTLDQFRKKS